MIIKKFQAGTETEAIMLAKESLGKDAIVMNIKTISPKGIYKLFKKPVVEITAAADEAYKTPAHGVLEKKKDTVYPAQEIIETAARQENYDLEKKIQNLQTMLEKQIKEKAASSTIDEKKESTDSQQNLNQQNEESENVGYVQLIYNKLVENEVDEKYANQIVGEIEGAIKKESSVDHVLSNIYQKIVLKLGQTKVLELNENKTKYVFFIGPTGVGKTTTIAKIASSFALGNKAKLAMMTADTYRIAAVEQLRTYANIMQVPIKVIYSAEEIDEAKEEFKNFDLVLVDTAGRSHRSKEQRDDVEKLIKKIPAEDREVYLVLSVTTKYEDLIKIVEAYKEITDFTLLFTKLDETAKLGNIFNIKMLTGAPLSYTTFGQNVPDDISGIDAQMIAKQLLGGNE